MARLSEILLAPPLRAQVIADCAALVEGHVAGRGGWRGASVRVVFSLLRALRPDFVPRVVDYLLPDFADALDPLYQRWQRREYPGCEDFSRFLRERPDAVITALLQVTDARVEARAPAPVRAAYQRLRPLAEREIDVALPHLAAAAAAWIAA